MKRLVSAAAIATTLAVLIGSRSVVGQHDANPFRGRSDTGETLHMLPLPASVRSPFDTQPTLAPARPGLSVYAPS
jgi:hypothetical protein